MDLSLGNAGDGLAITQELRRHREWRDVAIVATTAHAFPEDRRRALAAGCTDYIAKPFLRAELWRLIGAVLRREV
jgi:CheY-like chemotaxis protein